MNRPENPSAFPTPPQPHRGSSRTPVPHLPSRRSGTPGERAATTAGGIVFSLHVCESVRYNVSWEAAEHLQELNPDVDVIYELENINRWLKQHPDSTRTVRSVRSLVRSWLHKLQVSHNEDLCRLSASPDNSAAPPESSLQDMYQGRQIPQATIFTGPSPGRRQSERSNHLNESP